MAEAEYISKEAALACFADWIDSHGHEHSADEMTEYQRIEELPEEDVRPVVLGKWIPSGNWNGGTGFYRCSICKDDVFMDEGLPTNSGFFFCPHCGADMREATP